MSEINPRLSFLARVNGYDLNDFILTKAEQEARTLADNKQRYRLSATVLISDQYTPQQRALVNKVAAFVGVAEQPTLITRVAKELDVEIPEYRFAINLLSHGMMRLNNPRAYRTTATDFMPLVELGDVEVQRKDGPRTVTRAIRAYVPTLVLEWALGRPEQYADLHQAALEFRPEPQAMPPTP